MKRFLNNLFRGFRSNTPRLSHRLPNRTVLQMDGLENRVVMSSAGLNGPNDTILNIVASAGSVGHTRFITLDEIHDSAENREIRVLDSVQGEIGQFYINPITNVNIDVNNLDYVIVDDSDGMPFATGSTISLFGVGGNTLQLSGSRTIAGNENYNVAATIQTETTMTEDGLNFQFTRAITQIGDYIPITGTMSVSTFSAEAVLTSTSYSDIQTLSNLGPGGNILTYAVKPVVALNEDAPNAKVILDATTATGGEKDFIAEMWGTGDQAIVATTPNSSSTLTVVNAAGSQQSEYVQRDSSPVLLTGTSSTTAYVGLPVGNGQDTLAGIKANVSVVGPGLLLVENNGNHTLSENVTVTESTISGLGLFGSNSAQITFNGVHTVSMLSGTASDIYNVDGIDPGDSSTQINIFDDSAVSFTADVNLISQSQIDLQLFRNGTAAAKLFIDAPHGKFSNPHPQPGNGVEDVSFSNGNTDTVAYFGFTSIRLED